MTWRNTTHDWGSELDVRHLERIRQGPAEFAPGGVVHLALEVLAYAADEAERGSGHAVVTLHADGSISVADNGRGTDPRFEHAPLLDDPQDLLVPGGHPLARPGGVELAEAAGVDWIVKRHHNDTHPLLIAAATAAGFTPRVTHQVKEWYAVSAMVAEGFGVCLLPRLVPIPAHHRVTRVPLLGPTRPSRRLLTCVRRGSADHPVIAAGLTALRAVSGSLTPSNP